ncbi:MAG TPA: GNAT family N-acetyltransferase [Thermoplasmata archaeon]|nr:GNAT family N-acetyltransferase [Thermoplasmata archaeon]
MSQGKTDHGGARHETENSTAPIRVRPATESDVPALVPLLVRLKRLNEEFDPLLKVRPDVEKKAEEVLRAELKNPKAVLLAAEGTGGDRGKVIGIVRAVLRERPFYVPESEGVILDIYLLPLYRRRGVGEYLLAETSATLKAKGAGLVTADFPVQNEIAVRFYAKRGFRPITALHARPL